jgi:hypothetical protein
MRTSLCVIPVLGTVVAAALAAGAGCGSLPDDCIALLNCPTSGGGAGGGSIPTPDECIPHKNPGKPVDDTCGVFVTSGPKGADAEDRGSKERPFKTLAKAVEKAKSLQAKSLRVRPVYACAEIFTEPLTIDARIELYGGLDCNKDWSYTNNLTTLTAEADKVPLTLTNETNDAKVVDFSIVAKDGESAGSSSIAVIADRAKARFERCEITAGNGAAGALGATPSDNIGPQDPKDLAIAGNDGKAACPASATSPTLGGDLKQNMFCLGDSIGGNGGSGDLNQGFPGGVYPVAEERTALGGVGQATVDTTLKCNVDANADPKGGRGSNGVSGNVGLDGEGAKDAALGMIDVSGYNGPPGMDGRNGLAGQGGGGGGGAKGKASACFGASGGGGGVGGCGGRGGKGGGSGGSSIGIISLTAPRLTLDMVTLKVGNGGSGGDGGDGQPGGSGGRGGTGGLGSGGTANACTGGDGGSGGTGGKGGGGRGGHSIGIAYTGAMEPALMEGMRITIGMPGAGGRGADATKDGVIGVQSERKQF